MRPERINVLDPIVWFLFQDCIAQHISLGIKIYKVHLSIWAKKYSKRGLGGLVTQKRSCYKGICFIVIVYYPIIKIVYFIITNSLYIYDKGINLLKNNYERWTSHVLSYKHIFAYIIQNWVITLYRKRSMVLLLCLGS